MSNTNCRLCQMGAGSEPELSQRQMAAKYGVGKASVGRHRKHLAGQATADLRGASSAPVPGDEEFAGIPGELVTARGASIQREDGSWVKVSWKPNAKALHDALSYDDLADIIRAPLTPVYDPGYLAAHTEVLCASDLQIGKAMQRGGGTPETLERARQSLSAATLRYSITRPECIVIADGGDPIENIFNVKGQLVTNDLDVTAQIRTFRRLMAEFIRTLAPLAPEIVYLSVPSNHGAVRNGLGSDSQAGTVDADFGLDINYSLEEQFEGREGFEHVRFVRPEGLEETAVLDTSGTRLAFNHGHRSGGILKHGEWWARQDHGRRPGYDADILVMSHYHSFNVGHSGNGRWIISASSSDPGSDWFTNRTGEAARQGMTAFSVRDGQWSDLAIL
jgi:hypothetical protein